MRIGLFPDSYYPQIDGVSTSVSNLTAYLKKKGHQVAIFAPKISGYEDRRKDIFRIPSFEISPILPYLVKIPIPLPNKTMLKLAQFNFDIIHSQGNGPFPMLGLATARIKKVPAVITFQTLIGNYAHYFLKGKIIKPKLLNNVGLKRLGNLFNGVIAPSEKMQDELISCGVKKTIKVIPNFVDFAKFKVKKSYLLHSMLGIPKNCPIILSVGRLGKEKNFEFLLSVFKKITPLNLNAHLVIVGEGVDYNRLIKLSHKFGLNHRLHLTGGIAIDQMPQVYADADIFVFASHSETQGMCVLEAAISGLPLVVAKDKAYKGMVINNRNGFVLPLDEELFAQKINQLLSDSKLRQKFSQNSPMIVKKRFDPDFLTDKMIDFYADIIKDYHSI